MTCPATPPPDATLLRPAARMTALRLFSSTERGSTLDRVLPRTVFLRGARLVSRTGPTSAQLPRLGRRTYTPRDSVGARPSSAQA